MNVDHTATPVPMAPREVKRFERVRRWYVNGWLDCLNWLDEQ